MAGYEEWTGEAEGAASSLARLKLLGVLLPIGFLVAIETVRFVSIEADSTRRAEHLSLAVLTGLGVVVFSFLIFMLIERAQREVMRQNRELAAVNAVSTAVRGEVGVERIVDAALRSIAEATGATGATVTVFARTGTMESPIERRLGDAGPGEDGSTGGASGAHEIEIPISSGPDLLGRLRLHVPGDTGDPDLIPPATLQNIGHQLACAIQIGQLVADLQRRKSEGHGLYDILLRISSQGPLPETLGAVARHGRELLDATTATISLEPAIVAAVGMTTGIGGPTLIRAVGAPGALTELVVEQRDGTSASPTGDVAPDPEVVELPLVSPEGMYGSLVVHRPGHPFTPRDRGFVSTLAELASIAVAGARLRESEQQAAVVSERERIAREMHDSLAQVLGVTHLRLLALRAKTLQSGSAVTIAGEGGAAILEVAAGDSADPHGPIATELGELAELAEEAYRDVREAILGLREASHVDRGFIESLRAYLERYSHQSGVAATLDSRLDVEPLLTPRAEVQIIRVVQEALTNVRKHAGASRAVVRIAAADDGTSVTIEDDGRGFDAGRTVPDRDSGFGLHTMRERMELLGGTLEIESARGQGTRVVARLPAIVLAAPGGSALVGAREPLPAAIPIPAQNPAV